MFKFTRLCTSMWVFMNSDRDVVKREGGGRKSISLQRKGFTFARDGSVKAVFKFNLHTFLHMFNSFFILKRIKCACALIRNRWNPMAFFDKGKGSFRNSCQSWRFEPHFRMRQPKKSRHKTAIAYNRRLQVTNLQVLNTFIVNWKTLFNSKSFY